MSRSPLKWLGGKAQTLDKILTKVPTHINRYHECFLGGGTVLIALLELVEAEKCSINEFIASDINPDLIDFFVSLRDQTEALIANASELARVYNSSLIPSGRVKREKIMPESSLVSNVAKGQDYLYYFWRQEYNRLKVRTDLSDLELLEKSGLFLVLNKTCFRGLYREAKHKLNTPFGNYDKLNIDVDNLNRVGKLFQKFSVQFRCESFVSGAVASQPRDFIYLDPPYYPVNEKSFTSYTSEGFNKKCHNELIQLCHELQHNSIPFLLSNSNTTFILDAFSDLDKFTVEEIVCRRSIHSKSPQSKCTEVLISGKV